MANVVDYFEIGTPDAAASTAFYSGLFAWDIPAPSGPAKYAMVQGDQGGLWDTSDTGGGNWAIFYVQVEDVQASIDQAVSLGATVAIPLVDNGQIYFAHLLDPMGNRFGIWHPKPE
jgi:predicted enzyme related to lactoylglutathione lyase